jgi:uncharacterized repeat protein (TIGR02543 family)
VTKPADPTKEGYHFVGWYADKAYTKPFAFDADIITANTTIYARFVEQSATGNEYTATLYVDGEVLESKTTVGGVLYALPTPQKGNEAFVGWWVSDYQSAEKLTYKYENQALTQNVNLYAVWESDGMQISVDSTGASWSAIRAGVEYTVTIKCGDDVVLAPKKTTALSVDYDFASSEAGEYTVTVEADGKTAVAYYKNKALARVSIFSVTDSSMFVFVGVENAEKYLLTIKCGNADHQHENYDNGNSTNYNFANCAMKEGGIEFVVTAVANGYISSVSDTPFVYNPMLDAVGGIALHLRIGKTVQRPRNTLAVDEREPFGMCLEKLIGRHRLTKRHVTTTKANRPMRTARRVELVQRRIWLVVRQHNAVWWEYLISIANGHRLGLDGEWHPCRVALVEAAYAEARLAELEERRYLYCHCLGHVVAGIFLRFGLEPTHTELGFQEVVCSV